MASGGKKKTTMAKLQRETRLRERRADKAARKDARKRDALLPHDEPDLTANDLDPESVSLAEDAELSSVTEDAEPTSVTDDAELASVADQAERSSVAGLDR
jgi:hypothetical protein